MADANDDDDRDPGTSEDAAGDAPSEADGGVDDAAPTPGGTERGSEDVEDAEAADVDVEVFSGVRDVLAGDQALSLAEVADQAGVPQQVLRELFEAMDWAEQPGYDERDVEYARDLGRLLDYYPLSTMVRTLRTRYRAMSSIVIGDLGTVRDRMIIPALAGGADAEELERALAETAKEIVPLVTRHLEDDYRHILLGLLDSEALARGIRPDGGREVELAVGFVDVEGYTALSGRIDPSGLDHVLSGFEDLVSQAVASAEHVLLAKFVGDAAMVVGPDPVNVADVLLGLVEDQTRLAEAPRRAGMAAGRVLVREGDYYGPVTNLAARLTDHARKWSLLASEDLEEHLSETFSLSGVPEVDIRGIGERRPFRVRRASEED